MYGNMIGITFALLMLLIWGIPVCMYAYSYLHFSIVSPKTEFKIEDYKQLNTLIKVFNKLVNPTGNMFQTKDVKTLITLGILIVYPMVAAIIWPLSIPMSMVLMYILFRKK